eukprot:g36708.t1
MFVGLEMTAVVEVSSSLNIIDKENFKVVEPPVQCRPSKRQRCKSPASQRKLTLRQMIKEICLAKSKQSDGKMAVDKDRIRRAMQDWDHTSLEWKRYEFWDENKLYTRNLIATDNSTFTLMLLCWNPGKQSPIHAHAGSECFFRCVQGSVRETRFKLSAKEAANEDDQLPVASQLDTVEGQVAHIHDSQGLVHRVANVTTKGAVTLHCYMPPIDLCKIFPEGTAKANIVAYALFSYFAPAKCTKSFKGLETCIYFSILIVIKWLETSNCSSTAPRLCNSFFKFHVNCPSLLTAAAINQMEPVVSPQPPMIH